MLSVSILLPLQSLLSLNLYCCCFILRLSFPPVGLLPVIAIATAIIIIVVITIFFMIAAVFMVVVVAAVIAVSVAIVF